MLVVIIVNASHVHASRLRVGFTAPRSNEVAEFGGSPLRPWQRISLDIGVALHRLPHTLLVTKAAIFNAAERAHFDAIARPLPDIDRADGEAVDKLGNVIEPICANA